MDAQPVSSYFALLRDEIPVVFLQKLHQKARLIYEEAYGRCFHDPLLPSPEARDLNGHMRRALFEGQMPVIADECGLPCEARSNKRGTSHYRVVRIGRLFVTCSAVQWPQDRPRKAAFRQQGAAFNHIISFPAFDFMLSADELKAEPVYVVIIHAPNPVALNEPGFISAGLPDPNWRKWLELAPIESLMQAQQERENVSKEQIPDLAKPKKKRKGGQG